MTTSAAHSALIPAAAITVIRPAAACSRTSRVAHNALKAEPSAAWANLHELRQCAAAVKSRGSAAASQDCSAATLGEGVGGTGGWVGVAEDVEGEDDAKRMAGQR